MPAVLALLLSYAVAGQRRAVYANTIAAGALVLALSYVTLEIRRLYHGPVLISGDDRRRRAIHLFDRVAGVRRGAARHRHRGQFAARPAGLRRRHRADDRQGLPDRHVDADGRLPRAVVHVPWAGAGGDRLAVPADPVPPAGAPPARRSRSRAHSKCGLSGSGCPDRIEELADLELEAVAFARQRLRRRKNLRGSRTGFAGAALHVADVGTRPARYPARPAARCGKSPASPRPALPPRLRWSRRFPTVFRWCR